jgi:hypothetical protein
MYICTSSIRIHQYLLFRSFVAIDILPRLVNTAITDSFGIGDQSPTLDST